MQPRIWILLGLLLAHLIVAVWDVYHVMRGQHYNTISATFYDWSIAYPIFPFIFGVIAGHVFWPNEVKGQ